VSSCDSPGEGTPHAVFIFMQPDARIHVQQTGAPETKSASAREVLTRNGLEELVRTKPVVAFAGAGLVGALFGGLFFPRLGRLAFLAVAGYAANELFQRQRGLDVDDVVAKASARRDRQPI
jgi:hypothetical protein